MSATTTAPPPPAESASTVATFDNRFLIVAVACQRVVQIRNGARARLDPHGHKACLVAVAEVVAGVVPYYSS